jgi:hypothetical protein
MEINIAVAQRMANDENNSIEQRKESQSAGALLLHSYCDITREANNMQPNSVDDFFININIIMGYAWQIGMFSGICDMRAADYFRPRIETELRQQRASTAGKKSGAERKQKQLTWQKRALELAIATRKAIPGISQEDLAVRIEEKWTGDAPAPGRRSLLRFISEEEKAKRLPRRSKHQ